MGRDSDINVREDASRRDVRGPARRRERTHAATIRDRIRNAKIAAEFACGGEFFGDNRVRREQDDGLLSTAVLPGEPAPTGD